MGVGMVLSLQGPLLALSAPQMLRRPSRLPCRAHVYVDNKRVTVKPISPLELALQPCFAACWEIPDGDSDDDVDMLQLLLDTLLGPATMPLSQFAPLNSDENGGETYANVHALARELQHAVREALLEDVEHAAETMLLPGQWHKWQDYYDRADEVLTRRWVGHLQSKSRSPPYNGIHLLSHTVTALGQAMHVQSLAIPCKRASRKLLMCS